MPIQSDDIKLLESAVMADVPEGGGAMTGTEVVDGLSNNIFQDISTDDRAAGRFNMAKLFGVAHTDDTDLLLGAHFAVLEPPADPLVSVALFQTPGWADERTTAKDLVERYMVRGRRLSSRIMETQYAGSRLLQLYQVSGSDFPAAGDSVALRNPDGQEQYVRIIKVTLGSGTFFSVEGGNTTSFPANLAVCELSQPLTFDVPGPPVARSVTEGTTFAIAFSTTVAAGAEFHGVKRLAAAGSVGGRSVQLDGGIYIPLVPAATAEEPLIDLAPLTRRQTLARTGVTTLTLPTRTMALAPGTTLRLPTAAQPATVVVSSGVTAFVDNGSGELLQGTLVVATIDYRAREIVFLPASPTYAASTVTVSYMPATPAGAANHSDSLLITQANQGLAYTAAFEPPPGPGTFTVSYMAQGRWYDLVDNGNGRLAGVDNSYGAGSINYQTGSIAYTLGALPDVGSRILYQWGDAAQAEPVAAESRPAALSAVFSVDERVVPATLVINWTVNGQPRSASCDAGGVISGQATGSLRGAVVNLQPAQMPDTGSITTTYESTPLRINALHVGPRQYSGPNGNTPAVPGSVTVFVVPVPQAGFTLPSVIEGVDNGQGIILSRTFGITGAIGTVNYATGTIVLVETVQGDVYERVIQNYPSGSNTLYFEERVLRTSRTLTLDSERFATVSYTSGAATAATAPATPAWQMRVPQLAGLTLQTDALAFSVGGQLYTALAGLLRRGWDVSLGTSTPAGSVADSGQIGLSELPAPGQNNAVTWHNLARTRAVGRVGQGVFRVETAPIKVGVFQIQAGSLIGNSNNAGVITGDGWNGTVDFQRGIVTWNRTNSVTGQWFGGITTWEDTTPVRADELTYNAVFLQYVPLDTTLLGLDTARLPLDGRVPGYRKGGQVIVHNTLTTTLPSNPVRGQAYSLGRQRIAAVTVRSASGVRVPGDRYTVQFDDGTITIPAGANLVGIDQPMTVHHRVEDVVLVTEVDISGRLALASALTHNFPANTSFVSSKLRKGDLFARTFGYRERTTWANSWQATADATDQPTASFNETNFPILVTNRGAITERWAVIFTAATVVRVVGEETGQVLTGVSINNVIEALNPETNAPYFSINPLGWGGGWAVGNVLLFETAACGSPAWVTRAVLQGPASAQSDSAVIMFGADVDA